MANTNDPEYVDPVINTDQSAPAFAPKHIVQGVDDVKEAEARAQGDGDTIKRAFLYGDNYGVQIVKDVMRKGENGGIDPTFDKEQFIERNKSRIDSPQQWRYLLAGNEQEATALLQDSEEQTRQQKMLEQRGGFGTFVARGVAGLIDIDAPLAIMSGGLSAEAKLGINATRYGRMTSGALTGAATQMASAEGGYLANPTEDWTSVPIAGLAGAVFGSVGGAMSKKHPELHTNERVSEVANEGRDKTLNQFGESVNEGSVLSKTDIDKEPQTDTDLWGAAKNRATTLAQEAVAEEPVVHSASEVSATAGGASEGKKGPRVFKITDAAPQGEYPAGFVIADGSAGAARMPSSGPGINSVRSDRIRDIIDTAETRAHDTGVADEWYQNGSRLDDFNPNGPFNGSIQDAMARGVKRFHDIVKASPLVTDFGRLMRTGSAVAQMLAYDIFENSSGVIRNNRSASALMEHYHKDLLSHMVPVNDAFTMWAQRTKQATFFDRISDNNIRREFNEKVMAEMQSRKYDDPKLAVSRQVDPEVHMAADSLDNWSAKEIQLSKGRPGEGTRLGFENMEAASGYMPQKWDGRKVRQAIKDHGYDKVVAAVTDAYKVMHKDADPGDMKIWAQAVIDRAQRADDGLSANLRGVLQADGRGTLEDFLRRNGHKDDEINRLIESITGSMEERTKPGYTKQRIDIDMRHVAGNGIKIMDLMDTDINRIISTRSRQSAGASALARKGIYSKADWDEIVEGILQDQKKNGQSVGTPASKPLDRANDYVDADKHVTKEMLDHMYSYFGSGPVAGGVSPLYSRIKKLTNLAVLNQLGLAQLAEFGPMIGAVGWKRFSEQAGYEIMGMLRKQDSELVSELKHMNILVPEEKLFRDDLTHEFERGADQAGEFMHRIDGMMNKAQRLQGYTSGFYAIRNIQQRISVTSAADRIMRHMRDMAGDLTPERLRDMGFAGVEGKRMQSKLQKLINDGTIEFKGDSLHKLNMDKWDPALAEDFALVLNRHTNQQVQKAMAGESSFLFHKDGVGALFFHLKAFPMQALEKQAYRTIRLADQESMAVFMYGLATAGAAYTIKQTINNRQDNLTAAKIANGAFSMSNLTGWIPMWVDPLAGMLGMDALRFNQYGAGHGGAPIFGQFPAYDTANRMAAIPGALQHYARGVENTGDVRALQAIPLIGNAYGFTAIFNSMKAAAKDNQKEIRKVAKADKKQNEENNPAPALQPGLEVLSSGKAVKAKPSATPDEMLALLTN